MKQLKNLLLVALLATLAWNCQKEETSIPQEETAQTGRAVHRTTLQQLPSHIREQVSLSSGAVQGKSPWGKGGEPFGEVVEDRVDVLETPDGTTSYTLGMEKLADGTYMDNLVVTEAMDGALDTHILRYRPSDGWLAERASGDVGWDAYSGEIIIFDGEGDPKAAAVFGNGQVTGQATGKGAAAKEDVMDCVVTDVSYGGVVLDGVFHVTDIIIDYECSGGGGDGLEPDPDLPNGGGQLPQGGGQPQGGGGGGPQGGGGNQIPTVVNDGLVFDNIINNLNNPCARQVVNKANLMDNEIASKMKEAFGSDDSDYDVTYMEIDLPDENGEKTLGQTDVTLRENGKIEGITIWLDSGLLSHGTDVSIFATAIHENMHALMFYQLDRMEIAPDNPNIDLSIMADEWSKVVAESNGGPLGETALAYSQHNIIAGLVNTTAGIIKDYALSREYIINDTQAEALAWLGLKDSVAWALLDQTLKDTYENIIEYDVTSFEILAVGTKCN